MAVRLSCCDQIGGISWDGVSCQVVVRWIRSSASGCHVVGYEDQGAVVPRRSSSFRMEFKADLKNHYLFINFCKLFGSIRLIRLKKITTVIRLHQNISVFNYRKTKRKHFCSFRALMYLALSHRRVIVVRKSRPRHMLWPCHSEHSSSSVGYVYVADPLIHSMNHSVNKMTFSLRATSWTCAWNWV